MSPGEEKRWNRGFQSTRRWERKRTEGDTKSRGRQQEGSVANCSAGERGGAEVKGTRRGVTQGVERERRWARKRNKGNRVQSGGRAGVREEIETRAGTAGGQRGAKRRRQRQK